MNEEHLPDSVIDASLEQLQQRYPQLANLQNLRLSKTQERIKRFKQSQDNSPQNSPGASVPEQQAPAGKWLQSYYERLAQKLQRIDSNFPTL